MPGNYSWKLNINLNKSIEISKEILDYISNLVSDGCTNSSIYINNKDIGNYHLEIFEDSSFIDFAEIKELIQEGHTFQFFKSIGDEVEHQKCSKCRLIGPWENMNFVGEVVCKECLLED
jgi:hypothetical protein